MEKFTLKTITNTIWKKPHRSQDNMVETIRYIDSKYRYHETIFLQHSIDI